MSLANIHQRLIEWAEWFSTNPFGLGYPSKSREYHLWKGPGVFTPANPNLLTHARAEEIETFVKNLKEQSSILETVLREHYFYPASMRKHAQRLNLPLSSYKNHLDIAQAWLAGRLSASIKKSR